MPQLDIKQVEFKTEDEGSGFITGYASTFDNWDSVGERPVKGAFTPHLANFLQAGFVALGHDWGALEIGMPIEAHEDDHGLFVKAEFHDTPEAQAARSVVKKRLAAGKDVSLSIGYEVLKDEFTQEGRLLKEVRLYEWSIVTVPANTRALVTAAKNQRMPLINHSETVLAAAQELLERYEGLLALRAKAGRVLSSANVARLATVKESLTALVTELEALLAAAEPEKHKSRQQLRAESLRLRARLSGVMS